MISEKGVKSNTFRTRLGTMDKKNPQTMYLFASTYISPVFQEDDYKKSIVSLDKELKLSTKDLLHSGSSINADFLLVTEAPVARISPERKVHYVIQFYFRPTESETLRGKSFNDISDVFSLTCTKLCENFKDVIEKHGFRCTKQKA